MNIPLQYSDRVGPLGPRVKELVREHARVWRETPADWPYPKRLYSRADRKSVEREMSSLVERIMAERKAADSAGGLEPAVFEKISDSLRPGLKRILGRVDLPVDTVYDSRFVDSTRQFLKAAREFDPDLRIDPVYQALRNVWIMNTLQYYLGIEIGVTESIFGYSLIYPYLDNFLDDADVPRRVKLDLIRKLGVWLEGGEEKPETLVEEKLRVLIGGIERQFPRPRFPGVFQSLLAIYNAQISSLSQQDRDNPPGPPDLLDISLEKGGTSVLADGYLAAGDLTPEQQRFCFGFGTILQLADDLQDIGEDSLTGNTTLFTCETGGRPLDDRIHALCRYTSAVTAAELDPARPREQALRELIPRGCILMIMEAAGKHRGHFSRRIIRDFQKAFPVRFSYIRKLRKSLQGPFLTGREKIRDLDPFFVAMMTISSRAFVLD